MYEDNICSLCIAVIHKNTGNPFLFRIADMRDGRLDPFTLDDEGEYGQENIDLIYNPNVPAEGSVGFWDWYSEDARRQRSFPNNTYRWIEYVTFDDVLNAKEVLARLRSGIEGILGDHDYLFEYERCVDGTAYCFFVRGADFQKSINSATVKDDVVCLNVYKIPKESIHEIKTWHMPDFHKQYYANLEFGEVVHKEYVRSVDSIIKTLIQSRITTYVPSNKKSDKAAVRNFLNLIPDSPLVNMLAERLECDENKARTYVDDFLARCETYFNCEDYDAQIMQRLIDSDTKVAHLFKNQIQDEWEQQNRALLEKANQQLTGIQDKIMDLQAHIEGLEQEKATKESNIAELELNYKKLQQTAGDIESGVRDKINAATQDIAEFFSEYALFMPCQQIVGANSLTQIAPAREIFSNDPEIIKDPDVLWACLQDNLIASGVDKAEKIENYYGLTEPVKGNQLVKQGLAQAKNLGVQIISDEVTGIGHDSEAYLVKTKTGEQKARTVIMATGSPRKKPKINRLEDFEGKGVSYCATCDAFFYRGKDVAVLGCCDYALSEALELIPIAKSVTIVTNGESSIQGIPDNIRVIHTKISGLAGSNTLEEIQFEDGSKLSVSGLFVAVGVAGSSDLAKKLGAQTEGNRIVVDANMATNIPGLYAAGDCTGGMLQIAKAVYEGAKAGTEAVKYHRNVTRSPK